MNRVTVVSGLMVAVFAFFAAAHTIQALYASGRVLARLPVEKGSIVTLPGVTLTHTGPRASRVGPVELSPEMNPVRLVLHTGYTPRTGNRIRYHVAMVAADGTPAWERTGFLGGNEDASSVDYSSVVRTFEVSTPASYSFEIGFDFMTLDDLRTASLELRRNVSEVNRTLIGCCVLGAVLSLIVNLMSRRRSSVSDQVPARRAA